MVRLIAAMALTLIAALAGAPAALAQDNRDVALAEQSVGRIELHGLNRFGRDVVYSRGSGFAVNDSHIVTNHHVIADHLRYPKLTSLRIVRADGEPDTRLELVAWDRFYDLAVLRKTSGADFRPSVIFGAPHRKGERIFALGYPAVVDSVRAGMRGYDTDRARVVRTSDEIITIYGDDDFPTHYLSGVEIAGGNSGGPMVDQCGQVLGVATWSAKASNDYRGGASSMILMRFLKRNSIPFISRSIRCENMADYMRRVGEEENRDADAERNRRIAERNERAQALRDARELARDQYSEARDSAQLQIILLLFAASAGGAAAFAFRGNPLQRNLFVGALVVAGVMSAGLVLRLATMPALSDFSAQPEDDAGSDAPRRMAEGSYTCEPDIGRSRFLRDEPVAMAFVWRTNGCVGDGRQYTPDGSAFEALLMPDATDAATHYRFDTRTGRLVKEYYDLTRREAAALRKLRPEDTSCTANADTLRSLMAAQERIESALPDVPNERIVYSCKPK